MTKSNLVSYPPILLCIRDAGSACELLLLIIGSQSREMVGRSGGLSVSIMGLVSRCLKLDSHRVTFSMAHTSITRKVPGSSR